VTIITLGGLLPASSRDLPGRRCKGAPYAIPIWSCSGWGLPCQLCCQSRGALLPHPFILTIWVTKASDMAVSFLRHYPWSHPRRALPGILPLWSSDFPRT